VTVVAAILAAGASRRLGRSKQLALFDGEPLVRRTTLCILASSCARVAVVVGAEAAEIRAAESGLDVTILENEAWSEGMASSIRVATAWASASEPAASGLLVAVVDQPLLDTAHVNALLAAFAGGGVVASAYEGVVGVPAIFSASMFTSLAALRGDQGARQLLRDREDVVAVPWPDGGVDIDTAIDLAKVTEGTSLSRKRRPL
jgi:molybdenum cofactor cytidylyltransferase